MPRTKNSHKAMKEALEMENVRNILINAGHENPDNQEICVKFYLSQEELASAIAEGKLQELYVGSYCFAEDSAYYLCNSEKIFTTKRALYNMKTHNQICEIDGEYYDIEDNNVAYYLNADNEKIYVSKSKLEEMKENEDIIFSDYQEEFIDNGDGCRTFYDGEGELIVTLAEFNSLYDYGDIKYCEDDGEYHVYEDCTSINDGDYYVYDTSDYYYCEHCGGYYDSDHIVRATNSYGDTVYYCESCAEDHTWVCDDCGETFDDSVDSYETTDGNYVCDDCREDHYYYCENCGLYYDTNNYDSCPNCESNRERRDNFETNTIYGYNEEHDLNFHAIINGEVKQLSEIEPKENLEQGLGGVELEVSRNSVDENLRETINKVDEIFNGDGIRRARFAHDGSIGLGFEIISEVLSREEFDKTKWEEALAYLKSKGYISNDYRNGANQCGLHYHINRYRFGETTGEQLRNISKLVYFFSNFWGEIVKLSRRCGTNHYAERPIDKFRYNDIREYFNAIKENVRYAYYGHCCSINCQNSKTVEIRVFRGTLNAKSFRGSIKFLDCLTEFVRTCRWTDLHENNIQKFFDGLPQDVIDYIKYRNAFQLYVGRNEVLPQLAEV